MRSLFTLIFVIVVFPCLSYSQEETNAYSITGQADYGFLLGHHSEMNALSTRHFPSFTLYLAHQTTGKKRWHRAYNYPEVGIGIYYSPLNYNDILGSAFSVFGYFDRALGNNGWKTIRLKFGFGPGFLSTKFDAKTNNQNIAIGSNINIFVLLEIQKEFRLSSNLNLYAGIGIAHFSNTGIQMPNLGLNLPSIQIALKYKIGTQKVDSEELPPPNIKTITHQLGINIGRLQAELAKAKSTIYNIRYDAFYSFTFKSAIIGSADLFYSKVDNYTYEFETMEDFFQAGIAVGYLLNMEQLQFMLQWGFYVYNINPDYEGFYHRIGFRWIATDHIFVNVSLLTEWARARNLEFGIGWRF